MPKTCNFTQTRRDFLKAGGTLAAAGAGAFVLPASAQTSFTLAETEITVLRDGHLTLPMNFVLPEQSAEEISALLGPHGLATDALTPDCNVTLLRKGDRVVLFDVGSGANFQPTAGDLLSKLEEAGVAPSDVTDIVLTHCHPDHLWGILDDFNDPLYPEANVRIPQAEWDYWRADDTLARTPDERKSFVVGAQTRLEAIEDQVTMITPGQEVLPGVEAVDTAGHTPGHMSYMIHDGSQSVLVIGDAISNAVISFEKPGWPSGTDQDREKGIETRKALLDRLAGDGSQVIGYHFPHPGLGHVERASDGYRLIPS